MGTRAPCLLTPLQWSHPSAGSDINECYTYVWYLDRRDRNITCPQLPDMTVQKIDIFGYNNKNRTYNQGNKEQLQSLFKNFIPH
jgi:hypothetical protein